MASLGGGVVSEVGNYLEEVDPLNVFLGLCLTLALSLSSLSWSLWCEQQCSSLLFPPQ